MKMPMMISNRSIITCFYELEREGGWKVLTHSSKGNEDITAGRAKEIGKNVVANNSIAYFQWRPYEGGMEIWSVNQMDPSGSIPDFIKNKIAKRMGN